MTPLCRVLHVMPSVSRSFGGPTEALVGFIAAARTQRVECAVLAPACSSHDEEWLRARLPGVPLNLFRSLGSGGFLVSPGVLTWLWRHGAAFDVVHVHGLFNTVSSVASRIGAARGWATIIRPFGTLSRYTFEHRRALAKRLYFRNVDEPGLKRARAIHFTTAAEATEALRFSPMLAERSFVVPPPWSAQDSVKRDPATYRTRSVLFMSRLHPKKNIEALIDSWMLVVQANPGAILTIAGAGAAAYVDSLKARAAVLGGSVRFVGFVEGVPKQRLLADTDVFVLPSHHENFGVAVLEALGAGLPVLVSAEVQLSGFICDHELGRVVDSEPTALASAIRTALSDDVLATRCRKLGPVIVAEQFSLATVGVQLSEMYQAARGAAAPDAAII